MIVLTDNIDYANSILDISTPWNLTSPASQDPVLKRLISTIFFARTLYSSKIDAHPTWTYLFVVDYAPDSQFQVLTHIFEEEQGVSGIVCLAGFGDNFKGQRNRMWQSLRGNLHLSAFLKPDSAIPNSHVGFTILSAVSVVQTLDSIPGLRDRVSIKWVNDILIDRGKVAGVLTRTQLQGKIVKGVFIGIGINIDVSPDIGPDLPGLKPIAIRSAADSGSQCSHPFVLKTLLANLAENYMKICVGQYKAILDTYKVRSVIVGKKVAIYSDPVDAEPQKIDEGIVTSIGDNLELYLDERTEPVIRGRVVLL